MTEPSHNFSKKLLGLSAPLHVVRLDTGLDGEDQGTIVTYHCGLRLALSNQLIAPVSCHDRLLFRHHVDATNHYLCLTCRKSSPYSLAGKHHLPLALGLGILQELEVLLELHNVGVLESTLLAEELLVSLLAVEVLPSAALLRESVCG